jgi:hypothetical protein
MDVPGGSIRISPDPERPGPSEVHVNLYTPFSKAPAEEIVVSGSAVGEPLKEWPLTRLTNSKYIADVESGTPPIRSGFVYDDTERIRKRLALDLFDLDMATLELYGYSKHRHLFDETLRWCVDLGLARRIGDTRYQLTSDGYMYRDIVSWLFFSDEVVRRDRDFYEGLHRSNPKAVTRIGVNVPVSGLATAPSHAAAKGLAS